MWSPPALTTTAADPGRSAPRRTPPRVHPDITLDVITAGPTAHPGPSPSPTRGGRSRADARPAIVDTLRPLHPPRAQWVVSWESSDCRFVIRDTLVASASQPVADAAAEAPGDAPTVTAPAEEIPEHVAAARLQYQSELEEALRPVVDGSAHVEVTAWSESTGRPASFRLRYPARAAKKAGGVRASVVEVTEDLHPLPTGWRWDLTWDSSARAYTLAARRDLLADLVPLPPIPATAEAVDLARIPIGAYEDMSPLLLSLFTPEGASHLLVVGASGSGKSGPEWNVLRGIAPMIRDGWVKVWLLDPKVVEFGRAGRLADGRLATTAQDCAKLIIKAARPWPNKPPDSDAAGHLPPRPEPAVPLNLIIIEILALTGKGGLPKDLYDEMMAALANILNQGRALGFAVMAATQRPHVDTLPVRDQFLDVLALRLRQSVHVRMVLGEGAREAGARCDKIDKNMERGVGYQASDTSDSFPRFRLVFVPPEERATLIAEYAPGRRDPKPPADARSTPAGEQLSLQTTPSPQPAASSSPAAALKTRTPRRTRPAHGPVQATDLRPADRFHFLDEPLLVSTVGAPPQVDDEKGTVRVTYRLPGEDTPGSSTWTSTTAWCSGSRNDADPPWPSTFGGVRLGKQPTAVERPAAPITFEVHLCRSF